ncbi:unnamed protein product [Microthlaspi erraticum]|uniref:Uncharacterized protein n=1 Tax=Microthlaspi erraticum TaxID=1685480 RepID=A0A6D2I007_9BRAS|nr:unnamed protein product [Microthlaspi erraticum]
MKGLVLQLAWSYSEADFRANLEQIKEWDFVVYQDVMKQKPETWCRAFYKIGNYCEDVENNSTESWNSTVSKAREKMIVPMLETIARLTMVCIAKRDVIAGGHESLCTPYVIEYLE